VSDHYDYGYCDHCDKYHDDADRPHRRKNNRLLTHESAFGTEDTIVAGEIVEFEEV
jgi:hypothetical protein